MPDPIKFPAPKPVSSTPVLALPRRRLRDRSRSHALEGGLLAGDAFDALLSAHGDSETSVPDYPRLVELERTLKQLEAALIERERTLTDAEARLIERERDLAETEALLVAREQLVAATRSSSGGSPEEREALERVRLELARQEASLNETRQALSEREQFLDESETKLFDKVEAQQAKENELEQREEDLRARERRLREREAASDPVAAAKLKADDEAAKRRDEFNE